MDRVIDYCGENKLSITLLFFLFGFLMLVISNVIGNSSVTFTGLLHNGTNTMQGLKGPDGKPAVNFPKEVGYLAALNWSVIGVIITPLIAWYGIGTLYALDKTIHGLDHKGMLRDAEFKRVSAAKTEHLWHSYVRQNRIIFIVVFICVFAFMMSDWWKTVGWPLLHPNQVHNLISDPSMEYDWSVASLYADVNTHALFAFGLVGYIVLAGIMPAFAFAVILSALHFVVFITNSTKPDPDFFIAAMPDHETHDKLCGFSSFYELFNNLLLTSVSIQFGLWLMTVQNAYLRDVDPRHGNIIAFLLGDVDTALNLIHGHMNLEEFYEWIGRANASFSPNIQIVLSLLIVPFIIVTAVGLCCYLLRDHADKARKFTHKHLTELVTESGRTKRSLKTALEDMELWPVAWMKEHDVFVLMAVLFVSLMSYRLMLLALVFGLYKALEGVKEKLQKAGHKKKSLDDDED